MPRIVVHETLRLFFARHVGRPDSCKLWLPRMFKQVRRGLPSEECATGRHVCGIIAQSMLAVVARYYLPR